MRDANMTMLRRRGARCSVASRAGARPRAGRGAARAGGAAGADSQARASPRSRSTSTARSISPTSSPRRPRASPPCRRRRRSSPSSPPTRSRRAASRCIDEALATVPGWIDIAAVGNQVAAAAGARRRAGGAARCATASRCSTRGATSPRSAARMPLETIKRIEVVTGPGGVLWGANSFLGIVNLITKDAEDVNGLEVTAGYGDGPGNKQDFKAYALFGKTFFNGKLKIFQHVSYENFLGDDLQRARSSSPRRRRRSRPAPPTSAQQRAARPGAQLDAHRRRQVLVRPGQPLLHACRSATSTRSSASPTRRAANDTLEPLRPLRHPRVQGSLRQGSRRPDGQGLLAPSSCATTASSSSRRRALFPPFTDANGAEHRRPAASASRAADLPALGGTVDLDVNLPLQHPPPRRRRVLLRGHARLERQPSPTPPDRRPSLPILCPRRRRRRHAACRNCPRSYVNDTEPLRRRRLRRRAVAPVPEADPRRRRPLCRRASASCAYDLHAARLGRDRLELPARLPPQGQLRDRLPPAGVPEHSTRRPAASSYGANPNLQTERSQSFQGELNARLLRNVRKVRELELRVDYSYTVLDEPHPDPQRRLRQHRQARHPLGRGLRQALPATAITSCRPRTPILYVDRPPTSASLRNVPQPLGRRSARRSTWSRTCST